MVATPIAPENVFGDAVRHAHGGAMHRVLCQVGVTCDRFHPRATEQPADHWQRRFW